MEAIYEKKYIVEVSDIDFRQQIKLSSLFGYLQDMATEHANRIGVGRDVLQTKYGVIWVLTRVKVDVIKYPKFKEEIIIETWPEQPGKLEFNRNFLVYDKDKNII
ncbi:MAG: acyl-ACP thioesterase, partial [Tissierellia bacterium]|nr:acyl-ACP thioesterase [Tissierellia bacterium]